jgi:hydroxypyruvate reductase
MEAFLLSDVIGNDSSVIASGPTVADPTTYAEALEILESYHISRQISAAVLTHLQAGAEGRFPETIKPGDELLKHVNNHIIGSNELSIEAALQEAHTIGLKSVCVSRQMVGEASQAALWFLDESRKAAARNPGSFMVVAGGETTVTVHGDGKGGRNLELALAAVRGMEGDEHGTLIALATDGEDGPTDAAGAVVTAKTMKRAKELGLNPDTFLQNNDAYTFFEQVGGLIQIGSTGTNVNDLTFYFNFP